MSIHAIRLVITLSLFWLLLSGYFDKINLLILGLLSVILVVFIALRMQVHQHKDQPLYFPFISLLRYWAWLFKEVMKSNIAVAKMIIKPSMPIKPLLKIVYSKQDTEIGRVIYANSITLTPGTVAMNVSLNRGIIVHALHQDSIAELEAGEMHDHVMQLEKHIFVGEDTITDDEPKPSADANSLEPSNDSKDIVNQNNRQESEKDQ